MAHAASDTGLVLRFPAATWSSDSTSCVLPFSRAGNLILLQARADTTQGNFIFDTGAPHLVLNITYFRNYPATVHADADQNSVTGAGPAVVRTSVRELSLGTLSYARTEADLVNLGHIENNKGVRILGLLGMELFRRCVLIIDYEKSLIYLHRLGKKESEYTNELLADTASYSSFPIELTDSRIVATALMGGKKLKFMIDSGAESNLLDSRLPDKVFEQVEITGRILLSGAGEGKVEALQGILAHFSIGGRELGNLPVVITNLEKTCVSENGCIDGMLGYDFLSLHKIGFNFVTRKMYIWK